MRAMVLRKMGDLPPDGEPLVAETVPDPTPGAGEVLIRVTVCGVCHTELDEVEGRTQPRLPVIPGHQVVGRIAGLGAGVDGFATGDRVGVAWIFSACGHCGFCREGRENLCPDFLATGRDANGGYAERMIAPAAFVHRLPDSLSDIEAAPFLCAGAVGWRALRLSGAAEGKTLGFTGFGASAHLVLQMALRRYPTCRCSVFARNASDRDLAAKLGAVWTGDITDIAPEPLDAIIDTTPAWLPVAAALRNLKAGGRLVINAIRKTDGDKSALLDIDYGRDLWMERDVMSVANVTRDDVRACLAAVADGGIRPTVTAYPLAEANRALRELKYGRGPGAKVLVIA